MFCTDLHSPFLLSNLANAVISLWTKLFYFCLVPKDTVGVMTGYNNRMGCPHLFPQTRQVDWGRWTTNQSSVKPLGGSVCLQQGHKSSFSWITFSYITSSNHTLNGQIIKKGILWLTCEGPDQSVHPFGLTRPFSARYLVPKLFKQCVRPAQGWSGSSLVAHATR